MVQIKQFIVQIKQFIEQIGVYVFFTSLFLFTQLNWMKRHNDYNYIEIRLLFAFSIGVILVWGIIQLFKKVTANDNVEQNIIFKNLSIALSPGIFFVFASSSKVFLIVGAVFCVSIALYIWVEPFRNYVNLINSIGNFSNMLIIEDGQAVISMEGAYEKDNPQAKQSFLIDLVCNFYECSEMKIDEVKIDASNLKEEDENELKPIIESIARYFNLKVAY